MDQFDPQTSRNDDTPRSDPDSPGEREIKTGSLRSVGLTTPGSPSARDQCLQFLSSANYPTLFALGGAALGVIYLFLGRLSLILFGVISGVLLHASWEELNHAGNESLKSDVSQRRRELGIEVANRLMNWRETKSTDTLVDDLTSTGIVSHGSEFSDFRPATAAALRTLTDAVIRDYVRWWYGPILPSESSFPLSCRASLTRFIVSISSHLARKRPADIFIHFATNASSIIIVFLNELSAALESAPTRETPTADAISAYLEDNPESNLANVLSDKQQKGKLKLVATDILQTFLEPSIYACEPMKVFLREVMSGVVLESVIENCSRPEWINGWIVHLLEEGEPQLMNAIDIGVDRARQDQLETFGVPTTRDNSVLEDPVANEVAAQSSQEDLEKRERSKGEIEMEEAIREANRLSAMIAVDNTRKSTEQSVISETTGEGASGSRESVPSSEISELGVATGPYNASQAGSDLTGAGISESLHNFKDAQSVPIDRLSTHEATAHSVLLGASVSIVDDTFLDDRGKLRTKPTDEYLLQIEPLGSRNMGWVIARKYADFEILHEVLRRISVVSGVSEFVEQHRELPTWKGQIKSDLRQSLERYLQHALTFERLANSEAMKRFLEKEQKGTMSSTNGNAKVGFSFPSQATFENMGKGVLGVLSNAPKGVAGGGKAMLDGVTGVFGANGVIGKRSIDLGSRHRVDSTPRRPASGLLEEAIDRGSAVGLGQPVSASQFYTCDSPASIFPGPIESDPATSEKHHASRGSSGVSRFEEVTPTSPSVNDGIQNPNRSLVDNVSHSAPAESIGDDEKGYPARNNEGTQNPRVTSPQPSREDPNIKDSATSKPKTGVAPLEQAESQPREREIPSLSEEETGLAVELLFAVINELYGLSSAWGIRKKLLNAAKSFLLRPGNPNIEAIRVLAQQSIITSNFSDDALAAHITVLRQNSLPTEDELKLWPAPLTDDEKSELRLKARKLFVVQGMPQALTSIMGASATTEALGHIFDSLQVKSVARGFIFALLLQAMKAIIQ
ncbi:hypothetical protein FQN55_002352 [Onygenales sp. PD_40]|nr:hypothetical protein FQN55_002352 [Onygenales sp. PD_40]KAK2783334.1 hypothetical protein FQN53_009225 [Emmonsiellopsis sp. PD_33]